MNSRSCDATRLLYCPAGKCVCLGDYKWNATAQNCSCVQYQLWNGFKCQNYGSYGDPCNPVQCMPTLTCKAVLNQTYSTGQDICDCDNVTYLDIATRTCIPKISYNASCYTNTDCEDWLGLACTNTGSTGKFDCI